MSSHDVSGGEGERLPSEEQKIMKQSHPHETVNTVDPWFRAEFEMPQIPIFGCRFEPHQEHGGCAVAQPRRLYDIAVAIVSAESG
jgi:hypothetical protein